MRRCIGWECARLFAITAIVSGLVAGDVSTPATAALVLETADAPVTQNFNELGTSLLSTAGLDDGGWRLSQKVSDVTFSDAKNDLAHSATLTNSTAVFGNYNFGVGGDRAIGFLFSGTSNPGPRSIFLQVLNNTGQSITQFDLSWDLEKYRASGNNRNLNVTFYHSSDGSAWTANTAGDQPISTVMTEDTFQAMSPPTTFSKSLTLSGLNVAHGSNYYLRWSFAGVGGSSGSPAVGLDNFSIIGSSAVTAVPEASAVALGSVAFSLATLRVALGLLRSRERRLAAKTRRARRSRRN